uniref:Uncharacterized protein n=1 Tax=Cucumis melo TaxID=3656 RepID=A0A9I9E1Y3_CUCME
GQTPPPSKKQSQDKPTWSARPHRGASIVQAKPIQPLSLPAQRRTWHSDETHPPSTKQSQ